MKNLFKEDASHYFYQTIFFKTFYHSSNLDSQSSYVMQTGDQRVVYLLILKKQRQFLFISIL